MSTTIDQRVVEMRFDNKHFENNVQTSLSTLDKLKQSLKLDGAAKGLENVSSAAKNCNLSPISSAVESVKLKFSALEVMGVTALANITNSAVNAGKRIVSALTIDPIKTGFQEYETQINAVQTILANTQSKGTTLDDVNKALDELNTYADKTIYNFTEMTRNIGTFTAAGIDLDTSVNAIQGIANLAAVSGSSSQQASTAMYQLSQALASGTVKLMDWNSVVNAGMGGQVFQDALKETARVHGIAIDKMIEDEGSFRETLSEGWLTSDILTETLQKFTLTTEGLTDAQIEQNREMLRAKGYTDEQIDGIFKLGDTATQAATKVKTFTQLWDTLKEAAQSGWTQTWEIIVGDFEEAKDFLTEVSDTFNEIIGKSAESRNQLLQGWKDAGGRDDLLQSLRNAFEGIMNVITPIKEAFREIFPPMTVEQLVGFTEGLKNLTARFKEFSSKHSEDIKSAFKGIFSVLDIGLTLIKKIISGIASLFSNFSGLGDGVLSIAGSWGNWLSSLRDSIIETDIFGKGIGTVTDLLQKAIDKVKEFAKSLRNGFDSHAFEGFLGIINVIWEVIKKVSKTIVTFASEIGSGIATAFRNGDISELIRTFNAGAFGAILLGIRKFISQVTGTFENGGGFLDGITDILDGVKSSLESWQQNIKAGTLLKIAGAIAILTASLWVLSGINPDKLGNALGSITVLFGELMGALAIFGKISGNITNSTKSVTAMIGMSAAVFILSSALKKLSDLDWDELAIGLTGLTGIMALLIGYQAALSKINPKKMASSSIALVIMGAAMEIFADVCKKFGKIEWESLGKAGAAIGGILVVAAVFGMLTKYTKKLGSSSVALVIMGSAMEIFADVCKKFGNIEWRTLGKAGVAIGGILVLAAGFGMLSKYTKKITSSSVALVIIGAAMEIFADVCRKFGDIEWEALGKSGIAMTGILVLASGFALLAGLSKKMLLSVTSLTILAASMEIFADVCGKFGEMEWESLGKAGAAIGGILALAAGFGLLAGLSAGIITGSIGLLAMATALAILTPILITLSTMSLGEIGVGLLAIAGVFTIFGAAAYILAPVVGVMLGLSAAILVFGAGCALAGAGILAISIALTSLAASLVVIAASTVEILKIIIDGIGTLITSICNTIADSAISISKAFVGLIQAACYAIIETVPLLVDTFLKLLVEVLTSLRDYIPQLVEVLANIVIGILDALTSKIPELVSSAVNFVGAFINALINALSGGELQSIIGTLDSIALIFLELSIAAKIVSTIPIAGAIQGVAGLITFVGGIALILTALGALTQIPGFSWLVSEGITVLGAIGTGIGTFVGNIIGGFAEGITNSLPKIGENLSGFMTNLSPFIEGVKSIDGSILESMGSLAGAILIITAADVLSGITSFLTGGSSISKFGTEISKFGTSLKEFSDNVEGINPENIKSAAEAAKSLAEMSNCIPNEGGVVSWFAGENSISRFSEQLAGLGIGLKNFSTEVEGVNPETIIAASNAAKTLAEMTNCIPNEGGVVSWFAGDNSISNFSQQLTGLGIGLRNFSSEVEGVNPETVVKAAEAAKILAGMTECIPNEGGVVSWFTGENSISNFSQQLAGLGIGLRNFATETKDIDQDSMLAAVNAAKTLAEMTECIPNEGGVVSWFAGDNSIANFSQQLAGLGIGLKNFSTEVEGVNPEALTAAANAAKVLAEMTNCIPNEGGVVSWFAGENSISNFSQQLAGLGIGIRNFSNEVEGTNPETMMAAVEAAKAIADLTQHIPNEGGVVSWFTGESSLANFSQQLAGLGIGLRNFSSEVEGINPETVISAANAAKSLAELTQHIPNEGGMAAWFSGESGMASFSQNLGGLGIGLKNFYNNVQGINAEEMTAATSAATSLAEMTKTIPNEGGMAAWFSGESGMASFSQNLSGLGIGLHNFYSNVQGINPETVTAAASAAKSLAEMTNIIPNEGGMAAWFSGESGMASFSQNLGGLGLGIRNFSINLEGVKSENIEVGTKIVKSLSEMISNGLPDTSTLISFGGNLGTFGGQLKEYANSVSGISENAIILSDKVINSIVKFSNAFDPAKISSAVDSIGKLVKTIGSMSSITGESTAGFSKALSNLAKTNIDGFINACESAYPKVKSVGETLMNKFAEGVESQSSKSSKTFKTIAENLVKVIKNQANKMKEAGTFMISKFVDGIKSKASNATRACKDVASDCKSSIRDKYNEFYYAGKYMVEGFADGIEGYAFMAESAARAMVNAAIKAAEEAADENSPSKETYRIGKFFEMGFSNAISDRLSNSYRTGYEMADYAKKGLTRAVSNIKDILESDIDTQPTIRPILDLSSVESGTGRLNGMLNLTPSVGVLSNVGAINSMMNQRIQNGGSDDVVSAIRDLGKQLGNSSGDSYYIDGVTYDDGSNISNAVKSLVRAARVERRR